MARGIPLVIIGGSWMDPCEGGKGQPPGIPRGRGSCHRWNWNKWDRNKLPNNDIDGLPVVCLSMLKQTGSIDDTLYDFRLTRLI